MPTLFESKAKKNPPVVYTPMGPLTSFAMHPNGVRFETQEEKEEVVLFLRQHIIVTIPWIILAGIMLIAPTIIFPFVFSVIGLSVAIPVGYIIIATIWWYVATFGFVIAKFLGWFINIYIVTNERIVDIDFYYLLNKHFSVAELYRVQDISYTSKGIIQSLFGYGDVIIQTAGEMPNLIFEKVPRPELVVETIRDLMGKNKK